MSGIFKGDSIYKNGGGGGGYKDGGALVDGDFIKVENNTVSSYENVSRDPINFYFEVKNGEILNSVVELTTAVNAIVNVYVIKNNIYYLLGNVGGNTVNAGEDYKLNVTGDSYDIEPVSGGIEPTLIDVGGKKYGVKKIGNRYWTTSNLMASASDLGITGYFPIGTPSPQSTYPGYFYCVATNERYNKINNLVAPFRLPKKDDVDDLKLSVNNSSNDLLATGFPDCPNATNSSGFNSIPCGQFYYPSAINKGIISNICVFDPDMYGSIERSFAVGAFELKDSSGIGFVWEASNNIYGNIRFCKDA